MIKSLVVLGCALALSQGQIHHQSFGYARPSAPRHEPMMYKQPAEPAYAHPEPAYEPEPMYEPEPAYQPRHPYMYHQQPRHGYAHPEPMYMHHPEPSYQHPEPAYRQHHEPAYRHQEPAYQHPEPAYMHPEPAYAHPEPAYQPEPAYRHPKAMYMAHEEPAYRQPEPAYGHARYGYQPEPYMSYMHYEQPHHAYSPYQPPKHEMRYEPKPETTTAVAPYEPKPKKEQAPHEKEPTYLGKFQHAKNLVSGDIFMLDESTLYIQGFSFDGQAPDVHFWSDGVSIPFYTRSNPTMRDVVKEYHNEDVVLMLPPEKPTVKDLKHFQVWCRQYKINFGDFSME